MAETKASKRKRSSSEIGSTPKWDKCLCHVKVDAREKLTDFTDTSWRKFKECSDIRKDEIWLLMKNYWNEGPKGSYHRQCYQKYTNLVDIRRYKSVRKDFASSSSKSEEILQPSQSEPPMKRLCRSQQPVFMKEKCIICQQHKFLKTHAKTREKLAQNISEYGSSAILRAAQIRNDTRVLLQIEGKDTIALEIRYHRSCYKDYVRQETLTKLEDKSCEIEDSSTECYKIAFEEVHKFVQREVIIGEKVVNMSTLLELFISQLSQQDIESSTYRSSKLKQRLRRSFADYLSFRQPSAQNQAELVFSSSIGKGEIIENMYSASIQVPDEVTTVDPENQLTSDQTSHQVFHASKIIRSLLLDIKPTMKWPPTLQDVETENEIVPDLLYNMLAWVFSSKAEYSESRVANLPPEVNRQVMSIAQDMIHCVSRGRVKTPKHVVLPMAVKSLTGSAEVVTLLNRFGHTLSYSQIEELETTIAEREIERQAEGILLPNVCNNPGVPAIFCWDNNDLQEETLSGMVQINIKFLMVLVKRNCYCKTIFSKFGQ
jgi:hypothetical protein